VNSGGQARGLAARAVEGILLRGDTLDQALQRSLPATVQARDRAQVQALVYGAVRWHHRHQCIIAQLLDRPLRRRDRVLEALLSVGLFELTEERQPAYAVVSACVEAARLVGKGRAAGLVNAALRRYRREADAILAGVLARDTGRYSHPQWLIDALRRQRPDEWTRVLDAAQGHPPMCLRVNRRRTSLADYRRQLAAAGLAAESLPGFPDALRLKTAVPVGELPGFAAGQVSVQDPASQLAADFLEPHPGHRVLDACAAPGGKAAHLLERTDDAIQLVAVDISDERTGLIRANLDRLGLSATVLAGDALEPATWWDGRPFDRMLVDAPCSATGVIRRHPDIKLLRRPQDIAPLAERQYRLLSVLWPLLRPGGRLLYSTCSVLAEENSGVVSRFLGSHDDAGEYGSFTAPGVNRAAADGGPGLQLLPGISGTDGFYYALIEKRSAGRQ